MIRAVELFAGAGGMGLGATRAGYTVVLAVEADSSAADTYAANHPETTVLTETIDDEWSAREALERIGLIMPDVVLGGPPCQGWSSLGARADAPSKERLNACARLFMDKVLELQPLAFVMENVRGLHSADDGERLQELVAAVASEYDVAAKVLKAADFGVPQLRHRLFIVGLRRDIGATFTFPTPLASDSDYLTVKDAIGDLPTIESGEKAVEYTSAPAAEYQRRMRGESTVLTLHEAPSHQPALIELLKQVQPGKARSDLPEALRPSSGFHNTYGRLRWDKPAPAVTAAIGRVSSGRHAHPASHRALTPREAARLQGFPDSYVWVGDRWPTYKMIGNAVPPDLAAAVLRQLGTLLTPRLTVEPNEGAATG
jgi:DNA (cytosine-5)-methyltransferase 1